MNNLIKTFKNIWAIEDLRFRILNTLGFLLIFRLGSYIVLPGVDATSPELASKDLSGLLGLLDTFSGGAFSKASIFALGIMPYISASIVLQLLTVAVPYFQKLQKEGESGRRKINQYTRILTIFITIGQGVGYLAAYVPASSIYAGIDHYFFDFTSVIVLTAGTMFCMWLGERITDKGIGNGISMLIMVGIVSRLPAALIQEASTRGMNGAFIFIIELIGLFFVVMGVVMLTQATRRIPVQYAKQVVGNKVYGGERQYIPLKLNSSGVMPIIFAQSLMFVPSLVGAAFQDTSDTAAYISTTFSDITSWQYSLSFCFLIIVFTYFYTAIAVDPNSISNDLKRNNGFIPGVKPGEATADYIDAVISRITLPGAIYLCMVAILPAIASTFGITKDFSLFYGGTSLLIMVGVVLDTLQQIDSYLLLKHYEGMMKNGRVKGRTEDVAFA